MFGKQKRGPGLAVRFTDAFGTRGSACMLISAAVLLAISFAVRFCSGNPYAVMYRLRMWSCIPPVFLLTLLFSLWYILLGAVFGLCLGGRCRGRDTEKYKGGMLFVILVVLELLWFPCFFARAAAFFSLLLLLLCIALCVGVFLCFCRISKLCGGIMLAHGAWLIYLVIVNLILLLRA